MFWGHGRCWWTSNVLPLHLLFPRTKRVNSMNQMHQPNEITDPVCWFANWSSSENTTWWTSELRKSPHVQKMRLWESGICYSLHRCLYLSIRDYDKVWPNMYLLVQARWNRSEHSSEHHKMRCWLQFKVNRRKCRSLEFVFEWNINVNKFHWS